MDDLGVLYTDKKVDQLERKLKQTYKQAGKEIEKRLQAFTAKSSAKEKTMLQKVADGKISQDDFDKWKAGHVFYGESWKTQSQNIAHVLSNTNKVATQMINGEKADVFAYNMNYAAYDIERGFGVNFGFDVYDEKTVERLLKDNPKILPKSSLSISKDEKWNMRNIRSQVTQGIIQGDSIPKIAKRLAELVPERNANQMILHARTAMTSAQNGGRMERYKEAEALGIKFKKVWLATLDARTRPEHQSADGQAVKPDDPFIVGGEKMDFPGDPKADPSLIYNCRCTMVTELEDYPSSFDRRAYNIDNVTRRESYITKDTTYNEWIKAKRGAKITSETPDIATYLGKAADGFSDEDKQNIMKLIQNADQTAREVWLKNVGKLSPPEVPDPIYKSKAYYAPWEHKVHFYIDQVSSGDSCHTQYENFFHEFFHNIDHLNGANGLNFSQSFIGSEGKTLSEMVEIENKRILKDAFESWRIKYGYNKNMTFSFAMKNKYYREDVFLHLNMQVRDQYDLKARGNISDMFEPYSVKKGGGEYPWGVGHGSRYAKSGNDAKETFAEMADATFANAEALNAIKQYYPRSYALWQEMMGALLGN